MVELLSTDHSILEKGAMEFRPFGTDEHGHKIRDVSGVTIRAIVEYLEEYVTKTQGAEAGAQVLDRLCELLNARIQDSAYHVTPEFLKNVWNSYAYEFLCFLCEFGIMLSKDEQFQANTAKEKYISPIIQTLGRPFTLAQIYKQFPHFGEKFASGSIHFGVGTVTDRSAVLRMKFAEHVYRQFGPYRKRCAELICQSAKAGLAIVPQRVHGMAPAKSRDLRCIANGDEYCEWEFTWTPNPPSRVLVPLLGSLTGVAAFTYLYFSFPGVSMAEGLVVTLGPAALAWWLTSKTLRKELKAREDLIQEQLQFVESRHEELREAYLAQQQTTVELRKTVGQLTTLHRAGLLFGSIRDKETLLQRVLETILKELHYDRAMISFFDRDRGVAHDARLVGVSEEISALARSRVVPVTDPTTIEGEVILAGKPLLIGDIRSEWERLHPMNQELALVTQAKSLISVPLKTKDRILGSLTVDRAKEHNLTEDDLNLLVTLANQVAISLDNTEAYHQIEAMNLGLEEKVRERTAELEAANEQLKALDRIKSQFFANISHEFRTPLTLSLGAYRTLSKQSLPPESRVVIDAGLRNTARLLVLINELLDLAKIDSGKLKLSKRPIDFSAVVRNVAANFESGEKRRIRLRGLDHPAPAEVDSQQMKKVLFNLLSNACKFSDPEEGKVWVRLHATNGILELEVEDNGIGIPQEQLERIFDRFTQVEGSMTRGHEGTGIGLALVKEILALHGGTITVASELGQGSTFTIRFPRGEANLENLVEIEEEEPQYGPLPAPKGLAHQDRMATRSPSGSGPQVLVAEDNSDMREYLRQILEPEYIVALAGDGEDALEQARAHHPNLIVSDVMMPRMSGYDLLKAIRSDPRLRTIPVILLTARAGTDARIESLEAGADDYISKPFDEGELLARVRNLIKSREQEHELEELRKDKLRRFLPPQVAEGVIADDLDALMKSHRAEIVVLFIDLRGFTAFSETSDPEEVLSILREYQRAVGTHVSQSGGTLERFSGDSIMVFFDAPAPVQEQARQAVRLALTLRDRLTGLCAAWRQRGFDLGAGIGIASGFASVGLVGFEKRMDYAAIGPVTNLAARLCGEAAHQQILVPERLLRLVEDIVSAEEVGLLELRGFHRPLMTFNLIGYREKSGATGTIPQSAPVA